jgi:hypothetical protein
MPRTISYLIVFASRVTAACARALPFTTAPVCIAIFVLSRMVALKTDPVPGAAQTSVTSTNMVVLPGTADCLPAGVQNLGSVETHTSEQVLLELEQTLCKKRPSRSFLNEFYDRSSLNFHQFLTSQEFAAVAQWLSTKQARA